MSIFRVGDPDPTVPRAGALLCRKQWESGDPRIPEVICTWAEGHEGPHVAGNSREIVGVLDDIPDATPEDIDAAIASIRDAYRVTGDA